MEDFVDLLAAMPLEVKRNLDLLRDLDRMSEADIRAVDAMEKEYIAKATRKLLNRVSLSGEDPRTVAEDPEALAALEQRRARCVGSVNEKVIVADQTKAFVERYIERLDSQLVAFEESLRLAGDFDVTSAQVGDEVAIAPEGEDWVLGRVLDYRPETGFYKVQDADDTSNEYMLPETCVQLLLGDKGERVAKGEEVMAVYPDTTSFYMCTITNLPRRSGQSATQGMCTVQFVDDADETGATPHRSVPLHHILRVR